MRLFSQDIWELVGSLQVRAGQQVGCEATVHAMHHIFDIQEVDGVLLVDAAVAFNTISRQAALHNIHVICPPLSKVC